MTIRDIMYALWGGAISSLWWIACTVHSVAFMPAALLSLVLVIAICMNAYND